MTGVQTLAELVKDFNSSAINYIMEEKYHYKNMLHDIDGSYLGRLLIDSYCVANEIIKNNNPKYVVVAQQCQKPMVSEHAQKCKAFLTFYDFYFISEALVSCAEEKNNEELEMFCILKLDEALDEVYGVVKF